MSRSDVRLAWPKAQHSTFQGLNYAMEIGMEHFLTLRIASL